MTPQRSLLTATGILAAAIVAAALIHALRPQPDRWTLRQVGGEWWGYDTARNRARLPDVQRIEKSPQKTTASTAPEVMFEEVTPEPELVAVPVDK
jgi:hypothetical protein